MTTAPGEQVAGQSEAAEDFAAWVAGELRAEMGRQRVSQRELGRRLGRPVTWVNSRLMVSVPMTTRDLDAMASALGLTAWEVMGASGPRRPSPLGSVSAHRRGVTTRKYSGTERTGITGSAEVTRLDLARPDREVAA